MTAHQLIARAAATGISLNVVDGRVRVNGPEALVTPEFCAQLLQVKSELIRLLGGVPMTDVDAEGYVNGPEPEEQPTDRRDEPLATHTPPTEVAVNILGWIKRHQKQGFSKREAQQDLKFRFKMADSLDPGLEILVARGYISLQARELTGTPGRPPGPTYDVRPRALRDELNRLRQEILLDPTNDPLFALAQAKGFPGLYRFGEYVGAGENLWRKFCVRAHEEWKALASQALQGYEATV